jgi:hypothetical protein
VIAYKFLGPGAIGLFSGFRWPTPREGTPGAWVDVEGALVPGWNGVHAVTLERLTDWIDDELWIVELDGEIEDLEGVLLARSGRLLLRIEGWDEDAARAFAWHCVVSARDRAAMSLQRSGFPREAGQLSRADDTTLMEETLRIAAVARESAGKSLEFLADGVVLFAGGRPERYRDHPGVSLPATPGAIAANLGYVVAAAAGAVATDESGPSGFDDGFAGERRRQLEWLTGRLDLANALVV